MNHKEKEIRMSSNITPCGVHYFGPIPEENVLQQARMHLVDKRCVYIGLMADNHLGYSTPVGGVVAYDGAVSPSGVGYDIGCGNKAVRLNVKGIDILSSMSKIMDSVQANISFGVGRANAEKVEHELFEDDTWKMKCVEDIGAVLVNGGGRDKLKKLAQSQLGTVGSGNHYVDIFVDENDDVWIGVHFGSRGLGHKVATYFLNQAGGKDDINAYPTVISVDSPLGQDYLKCMELAGKFAYAGRDWVCSKVSEIIGGSIVEEIHNHHNFAWKENHDGRDLWVVRKGATPAFPGQKGFVGGSMGEMSVILEGLDSDEAKSSMYSTVHGAGRVLGRSQAKGKFKAVKDTAGKKTGEYECIREPLVKQSDMDLWVKNAGIELRGAGVDESPHCYKRIQEVLDSHRDSVKILHTLIPMGVAMAGNEVDPYKD